MIFTEDRVIGGRARVTIDEERVCDKVEQKSSCEDIEVGLL